MSHIIERRRAAKAFVSGVEQAAAVALQAAATGSMKGSAAIQLPPGLKQDEIEQVKANLGVVAMIATMAPEQRAEYVEAVLRIGEKEG